MRVLIALVAFAGVAALNLLWWWLPNRPVEIAGWTAEPLQSVSFAPYRPGQSPLTRTFPTPDQIEEDLKRLQGKVRAVRTYSSGENLETVPQRAGKYGLKVWHGAWLNNNEKENLEQINLLIDHAMRNPHITAGFWRGVNLNQNTIYLECFMDELAHATKQDPLAFRRKLMANNPKHLAVLDAVAEKAGWGKPAPKGVYRGLAQTMGFGSYVAACAEVSVDRKTGKVKVHRIIAATDPGYAVNPQQIEAQVEGSFVYGLSAALYGECTLKDGQMEQQNFDTYQVLKLDEMPKVESIIMPSGGFWGGVGEPTIAVAAPAVLNAIFAATGKRVRDLPLKNHSLKKA